MSLMWPFGVVDQPLGVEGGLHLVDCLEPRLAALHQDQFIQLGAMQPLDDANGSRSANLRIETRLDPPDDQ